jgi:hypothetical protein
MVQGTELKGTGKPLSLDQQDPADLKAVAGLDGLHRAAGPADAGLTG